MKKITSTDIARMAGVSRTTVSYVLNGVETMRIAPQTRDRILELAREAGYQPNRLAAALQGARIHTVGLVTAPEALTGIGNTYSQSLFVDLSLEASKAKMQAMIFVEPLVTATEKKPGLLPTDLLDGRVDGVIVFGHYEHREWMRALCDTGLPCVEIGAHWGHTSVQGDNRQGLRLVVEHLLEIGHRRIAYWSPEQTTTATVARRESFLETVRGAGLPEDQTLIVSSRTASALEPLLDSPNRPTAVVAFNDAMAFQALGLFRRKGLRVPDDISLTGYDNDLRAVTMYPALTTVANPLREVAGIAMNRLVSQIDHPGDAPQSDFGLTLIPTNLIVRDSTAPPRQT